MKYNHFSNIVILDDLWPIYKHDLHVLDHDNIIDGKQEVGEFAGQLSTDG